MSPLSSLAKSAQNVVRTATQQVDAARHEVQAKVDSLKPQALPVVKADTFEQARGVSSLYDPGTHAPNRATTEHTATLGRAGQWAGQGADGSRSVEEGLAGARAHAFAQKGPSVWSAGVDGFAGTKESTVEVLGSGDARARSVSLGVGAEASAFAGSVNGAKVAVEAGLSLRDTEVTREGLGGGRDLKHEQTTQGLWGAVASAGAQVGTVTGASVDLFAGARGGQEQRAAVVQGQHEVVGAGVRGMGMVGVGVKADLEAGYDVDNRQARISGGAGAALLVGGYVGGEVTVGGDDRAPSKTGDLPRAVDLLRGRIGA